MSGGGKLIRTVRQSQNLRYVNHHYLTLRCLDNRGIRGC